MPSKGNINIVHDEQIWRDHIRTETIAVKAWEAKWGFTKDIYPEMYSQANQVTTETQILLTCLAPSSHYV